MWAFAGNRLCHMIHAAEESIHSWSVPTLLLGFGRASTGEMGSLHWTRALTLAGPYAQS